MGKKGVVREKSTHEEVIWQVMEYAKSIGFAVLNLEYSPIKGPEGNIEYLLYLQNSPIVEEEKKLDPDVKELVERSHQSL